MPAVSYWRINDMSYITTYTGKHFDPADPDPSLFDIRDIAHALSLVCRGNGHVSQFYSVGQHCCDCAREAAARGCSPRLVLACLLHDACEIYLSDIPRPFKQTLPQYAEAEERMLRMIYTRFLGSGLSAEEKETVKQVDDDMLWYDLDLLLPEDMSGTPAPEMRLPVVREVRPFAETEQMYLSLFDKYSALL